MEILSENWTEDKARQLLSEGFLASLTAPVVSAGPMDPIDRQVLKDRLRTIRKVLADECMVEDDVTDVMLLDATMNALADRIEVHRLQAERRDWDDIEQVLEIRYKADKRLIEAIVALKSV